jgi:hypothetical protein
LHSRAAVALCVLLVPALPTGAQPTEGERTFSGSWSATGQQETIPTEGVRAASIVRLSGSLVLTGGNGLGRGFRGEAIGFDDGAAVRLVRSVWTDDRGDRIFSEIRGEPLEKGRRWIGTITGGSGPYARMSGEYELTWQYVIRTEDGAFQGRAADLKGRFHLGSGPP